MPPFRPRAQHDLERLDDDALIAYMREAGAAGHESAGLALAMLAYGYRPRVRARVRLSEVPAQDVDELTDEILEKRAAVGVRRELRRPVRVVDEHDHASGRSRTTSGAGPGGPRSSRSRSATLEAPSENAVERSTRWSGRSRRSTPSTGA